MAMNAQTLHVGLTVVGNGVHALPLLQSYRRVFIVSIKRDLTCQLVGGVFRFSLHNRPIWKVHIMGIIIAASFRPKKVILSVDDGTEVVRCTKLVDDIGNFDTSDLTVGALVSVKGSIEMSSTNQDPYGPAIRATSMEAISDPNMESFHWLRTLSLQQAGKAESTST